MNFSKWHAYFLNNQPHFDHLDWNDMRPLTAEEKNRVFSSIRQFQRGEYSEGKHFLAFAKTMNDASYVEAVRIFIKEEQDHAMVLGRFMDIQQIPVLKNDWLDNVFRRLRKLAGLEGTVTVLLTAEIISMVYYKALRSATNSELLRQICKQVLTDEEMHLQFQSFALRILYARKNNWAVFLAGIIHTVLMAGTIVMVWLFHQKVLRGGKYSFFSFFKAVWTEFGRCRKMIKGGASMIPVVNNINHAA